MALNNNFLDSDKWPDTHIEVVVIVLVFVYVDKFLSFQPWWTKDHNVI